MKPPELYPRERIPEEIIKLCQNEYNLPVKIRSTENTVWVYVPVDNMLDNDLKINKDFSETVDEVSLNISRTVLNAKNPPDFYVLAASDIKFGADYFIIGYVPDIIKHLHESISREDFISRHLMTFELNPKAIGDKDGKHLKIGDITLGNFIAEQIAYRIRTKFEEDALQNNFKLKSVTSILEEGSFKVSIDIEKSSEATKIFEASAQALKIINYTIQSYDFEDFTDVEIEDVASGKKSQYGRLTLEKIR